MHIDLYRLEKPEELEPLKLDSVFVDPKNLIVIEWPERAEGRLPEPGLRLDFSSEGAALSERYIDVSQ